MQELEKRLQEESKRASNLMDANQDLASEIEDIKNANTTLKGEKDQVCASLQEMDVLETSCSDAKGAVQKLKHEWKKKVTRSPSAVGRGKFSVTPDHGFSQHVVLQRIPSLCTT